MFVNLKGERVALALGRWSAAKALESHMSPEQLALVDLVKAHGLHGAADTLGIPVERFRAKLEIAKKAVSRSRSISQRDLSVLDLVDELGYSDERAAEVLGITLRECRQRYWRARKRLNVTRHDEILTATVPGLKLRDFAAFELHFIAGYTIGKVARILGLNRGHMVRRVNMVRELLREHCQADTPHIKT